MGYYILRAIFRTIFRAVLAVCGGLRVENAYYVPKRGAVIIAPNHNSFSDPVVVGLATRRPFWIMATEELFSFPLLGRLARWLRAFPVQQDSPDRSALRRAEQILMRGEALVIFPEGHVSKDAQLQPIQGGTILLAMRSGAPIVPMALVHTERLMPAHTFKLHHAGRPIVARFGRPIPVEELTGGLKGREGIDYGVEYLRNAILKLLKEAKQENDTGSVSHVAESRCP